MRKFWLTATVALIICSFFVSISFAKEEVVPPTKATEEPIYTPKLLPDSSFYFLKSWKEKIELLLAQAPEVKAEKYVEFSTRRVAEAKMMIKKNKPQFVAKLMEKHKEHLDKAGKEIEEAREKGRKVERVLEIVTEATSQHLGVLAEVYEKVPEPAKSAIEHAIEVSSRGQERALEAISKEKREELRRYVEEKLEKKKPVIKKVLEKRVEETLPTEKGKAKPAGELEGCVCITLWEPVCGVDGKTYTNQCWLECAGTEKAYDGECKKEKEEKSGVKPGKFEF